LQTDYTSALEEYLTGGGETTLDRAYEIGRAAVENRLGVLDVTQLHQEALEDILTRWPQRGGNTQRVKMASSFLSEALAPFEMTQRGYQETVSQLRQLNETLEYQVDERTRELRDAEAKYRTLVEQLPAITYIIEIGAVPRTTYISPQVESLLGFSAEEWLADPSLWVKQLHPEDRGYALAAVQPKNGLAGSANVDYRILTRDGRVLWFHNQSVLVLDHTGRPRYAHGLLFDITERKRAEQEVIRRLAELEAVNRISTALRAAPSLNEMLPTLLDETLAMLGIDMGAFWLYDSNAGELRVAASRGWTLSHGLKPGEDIPGHVFVTGQSYIAREFKSDPHVPESVRPHLPAGLGGAVIPIRTAHDIIGVLGVAVSRAGEEVTTDELRLLTITADIAANAIHRARLYEDTRRRAQHLAALHTIDVAISSSFDLRITLNVLLEQVIHQLGVDAADILLLNPYAHMLEYAAGRGFRSRAIERSHLRLGEGHAGRAALERRRVSVPNLPTSSSTVEFGRLSSDEEFIAYHGVPLIAKGQVKGVLEVFHRIPLNPDPDWLAFLETLAGQAAIAIDNASLFNELQHSNTELTLAYDTTIEGWSRALDLRDRETEGHTQRVTEVTVQLARMLGLTDMELVHVRRGALLHDIGKMGVPDSILLKPGHLTEEEWAIMRKHPQYAYDLLSAISFLHPALEIPYCHHEKWDGTGYPRQLKGDAIPLSARIFAVVDVWDALRSDRPYRAGWPAEKVLAHIRSLAGTHFDPQIVDAFLRLIGQP
jgi:PAS domain S-box-containing protein/putative nucleotidyltransferase with HDIG domain